MKRWKSCLLAMAAAMTQLPVYAGAEETRALLVALSASVLRIEGPRIQGGYSLGSAVVVEREMVVTNCHVTRDAREIFVVRGGARWPATAQLSDIGRDLCLLRVPGLRGNPVAIGRSAELALGQSVAALGYTGGVGLQTSQGDVVGLHRFEGAVVVQSNNWFSSGASGGGLFDTEGRLVGILTFRLRGDAAAYFSAPTEWLRDLMADFGQRAVAVNPLPADSVSFWQRDAHSQPRFLRAASLLQTRRFTDLEALAAEWLGADAGDSEPWHLLGASLQGQHRDAEALWALGCSLAIEPGRGDARRRLAAVTPDRGAAAFAVPVAKPCRAL